MTRIGLDVKLPSPLRPVKGAVSLPPLEILDEVHAAGLDGVLFRTLAELSPGLDAGYLRELRERADALGLYLDLGVGKVNPYMIAELPEVREIGGGSYLAGMEAMIEAAAAIGCRDLWTATGNYKAHLPGLHATDRYRGEAPWPDQLAATERFLRALAPCLRANGVRLALETHEEITSWEVVRLVESVGPDVLGVTFDSANVYVHGEDPLAAARRVAPYTRATHLRDVALFHCPDGLSRYLVPCGVGVIDWAALLGVLDGVERLTIEPAGSGQRDMTVHSALPAWREGHPDLVAAELAELDSQVAAYAARVAAGTAPGRDAWRDGSPYTRDAFTALSARHLRDVLGLPQPEDAASLGGFTPGQYSTS
ncbi:sugar phosphate isomerase/epimerase family protein [Actinocorallia sp. A-T 12471]|uniref:sugar phosphate isomerase/epimerase family protein n=1 Tax=Actinocorallia sp. A-T 12471 TaxID=3089813 RepID=UPI0029CD34A1|nr:sugar phosphate isomerase/epimerase family protein [Actinocorallia sp. A-T 12471]MDX6740804.1 sugar phosphate isomerase/epimerase family protein [Actinocorallia sp. A-T 12471]